MAPQDFLNYPPPVKAAETPYENPAFSNPTLSGIALSILSTVTENVGPLQQLLWNNAGFTQSLAAIEKTGCLDAHVARYDPTVTSVARGSADADAEEEVQASVAPRAKSVFHSSADYIAAYKSGATTPTEVAERFIASLGRDERNLVFISVTPADQLLAAARESTARYAAGNSLPLDGVPLVVKDELDVAGTPKTLGLTTQEAEVRHVGVAEQGQTSWCVQKLLDAGMLFLGKSNMHEIGLDTTNNNPNWGTPPNPYNKHYYPGGSSGGSGAAVGGGIVPIAVGADGGGSIRVPAAYCGVYGLKPTHGRVSSEPTVSIAPSVGVVGPIAATIDDLELAYRIMATPDPTSHFPPPTTRTSPPPKKTLGIYTPWFNDCDAEVLALTTAAIAHYRDVLHYDIVEISLPYLASSRSAHALTILSEIGGVFCQGNTRGLTPANKVLVSISSRAPARDLLLAQKLRALMMSHLAHLFQQHPGLIIVTPTTPHVGVAIPAGCAVRGGPGVSDSNTSLRSMQYVFLANWAGCPAVTMPCGYSAQAGMPVGLMGMAEWCREDSLIDWAREWADSWEAGGEVEARGVGGVSGKRRRGETWLDLLAGGEVEEGAMSWIQAE
ncbi:amidase signature domain-containing protein [Tricharina praecox]|uniref:amidase signature domain-containing protein n=1 Tax=Tricharina praecox TaxID=43433 RepID=UPI00221FDA24|nr:amidase signature domain-containing protein [Tricharina praecox]KAI5850839.1 amidase signature domain-containing protein [Tricharina praecox]